MPQKMMRTMLASSRISIVPAATAGTAAHHRQDSYLMTEVAEAEALILAHMPRFPARHEPLAACVGRVLAEDIHAERDQPPFDRVTMDGIAVAFRDFAAGVRSFEVVGTQAAGAEPLAVAAAQCVEVMTGTPLPRGADTVVPVERVQRNGAAATIAADAAVARRAVRPPARQRPRAGQPRAARRHSPRPTRDRRARRRRPCDRARRRPAPSRRDLDGRRARRRRQADRSRIRSARRTTVPSRRA